MGIKIKAGVHNSFEFVKRDTKTGEVLGKYKAENIILDNFWGVFLSSNSLDYMKYIHFGSGTTEPQATDTALTSWLGYKTAPTNSAEGTSYDYTKYHSDGVISIRKTVRLEDTEYNGESISEVGYSNSTSGTSGLLTKAIVKDMNGNPITINKEEGTVLDIFATFFIDFGLSFNSNKVRFGHEFGDRIQRAMMARIHKATDGNVPTVYVCSRGHVNASTLTVDLSNSHSVSGVPASTDAIERQIAYQVPDLGPNDGNLTGGIRGLYVGGLYIDLPCTGFEQPVIEKEVVGTGDGLTTDFQTKFGFIKNNGTAKVYVNGVEVAATVDYDQMHATSNIAQYLKLVSYKELNEEYNPPAPLVIGASSSGRYATETVLENENYQAIGITSMRGKNVTVYASNDLEIWTQCINFTTSLSTISLPSTYKNYRYFKFLGHDPGYGLSCALIDIYSDDAAALTNIHLSTAPAEGDVVAVTYQPDCIAKDETKVIQNVSVVISFNEYTP